MASIFEIFFKKAAKDQSEFRFIKYNEIYLNQHVGSSRQMGPRQ